MTETDDKIQALKNHIEEIKFVLRKTNEDNSMYYIYSKDQVLVNLAVYEHVLKELEQAEKEKEIFVNTADILDNIK